MKNYFAVIAVLIGSLVSISVALEDDIIKFAVEELESEDISILDVLRGIAKPHHKVKLSSYSFKNCDKPGDLLNVTKLTLGPDPISFPGTLQVDFAGVIAKTLDAPLKADLVIQRRVGQSWIKIPCIGTVGSCTYDDLCDLLKGAVCPPPFVTNGVPCKCPFNAGSYKMPNVGIEVDAAVFPPGDYHAKGSVVTGDSGEISVGCIEVYASFA